jgi:Raf kinase inhibitor-like YbhB/YbcL family protein
MSIRLTSTAFEQGRPIPKKFTGEGVDVSPPLAWADVPKETRELALICDDPDAPRPTPWVHWVLYKIPADAKGLPEGVARKSRLEEPAGALQGENSWPSGENVGYRGPMPPPGKPHRYFFRLCALDAQLDLKPGMDKDSLLAKIHEHTLATGELMGTYQR